MGTLGGIGELAREVFGDSRRRRRRPTPRVKRDTASRRAEDRRLMFDDVEPGWLWMIGGVLLLIAEVIAPGFFLMFIGAAAMATGALHLAVRPRHCGAARPCSRSTPLLAVMVGRRFYANANVDSSDPLLNDRSGRLVGKSVDGGRARSTSMAGGSGSATANGTRAAARPRPATRVRITGVDGNCLNVETERTLPGA